MNIKEQVLTIEQVRELQELGFDVEKHASMCWIKYKSDIEPYEETYHLTTLDESCYEASCLSPIPTLTVGDIMDILPKEINDYYRLRAIQTTNQDSNIYYCAYVCSSLGTCKISFEDKTLIIPLFETLKWCIKEKHIAL